MAQEPVQGRQQEMRKGKGSGLYSSMRYKKYVIDLVIITITEFTITDLYMFVGVGYRLLHKKLLAGKMQIFVSFHGWC